MFAVNGPGHLRLAHAAVDNGWMSDVLSVAARARAHGLAILVAMRRHRAPITRTLARPTPLSLLIAAGLLAVSDWASHMAGDSVFPGGPLDECAHLMTMLLVLWALGPAITRRFLVPALIASVAIDADHLPQHLGTQLLTQGTPRPYTHSLLTVVVVLALAPAGRRRRTVWLGVAIGLLFHFWRDLSEAGSGVSLLWPVSSQSFSLPHWSYMAVMVATAAVVAGRLTAERGSVRHASRQAAAL
jgi:inner membrane protein